MKTIREKEMSSETLKGIMFALAYLIIVIISSSDLVERFF